MRNVKIGMSPKALALFREAMAYDDYAARRDPFDRASDLIPPPTPATMEAVEEVLAKISETAGAKFSRETKEMLAIDSVMGDAKRHVLELVAEAIA